MKCTALVRGALAAGMLVPGMLPSPVFAAEVTADRSQHPDRKPHHWLRRLIEQGRAAAYEMNVGRYYQNKKDLTGAINRFKVVVTHYQTTRHVEEALMRITECYMTLGIVSEAQTAAAGLGHNFPDSSWYQQAYSIVKSQGLEPHENNVSWISKAFRRVEP